MTFDETWWPVRALRASPPGLAGANQERGAVFAAALEQAEQLLRSAYQLGAATRPLNLFYGLSQAGRALAAAFIATEGGWKLQGHGISATDYTRNLEGIQVSDKGRGSASFTSIAMLLNSPSLPAPTAFGKILSTVPVARIGLAPWMNEPGPLEIQPTWRAPSSITNGNWDLNMLSRRFRIHGDYNAVWEDRWAEIKNCYPQFEGCVIGKVIPSEGTSRFHADGDVTASNATPLDGSWKATHAFEAKLLNSAGRLYAVPALPGAGAPLHPLVSWWAILFTLSMIARYEPAFWISSLNVDTNPRAVPLEIILDSALTIIPELIADTFRDLAE